MSPAATDTVADRAANLKWDSLSAALDADGYATTGPLLPAADCAALIAGYEDDTLYRRRVVMARHGYGQGEYRYFAYPLPDLVATLRETLYPPLAAIANRWNAALGVETRYPETHAAFRERCHAAGQERATPLVLRYGPGDYNRLHQDLYGAEVFPLQAAFLLSRPTEDFTGGEFVLTSQRPRVQSRVDVVPLTFGEAVIFPVRERPETGKRGFRRVAMRHGVGRLRSGSRYTLGIIFHDAALATRARDALGYPQ
jgi:hypothetical protein